MYGKYYQGADAENQPSVVVDCGTPPVVLPPVLSDHMNTTYLSAVWYYCQTGYQFTTGTLSTLFSQTVEPPNTPQHEYTAVCQADGNWTFPHPLPDCTGKSRNYK